MVTLTVKAKQTPQGEMVLTRSIRSSDGTEAESYLVTQLVEVVDALMDAADQLLENLDQEEDDDGELDWTFPGRN